MSFLYDYINMMRPGMIFKDKNAQEPEAVGFLWHHPVDNKMFIYPWISLPEVNNQLIESKIMVLAPYNQIVISPLCSDSSLLFICPITVALSANLKMVLGLCLAT